MALQFSSISIMGSTKDTLDAPVSATFVNNHVAALAHNFRIGYVDIAIPMNTNAQAFAARGSNFGIDPAAYAQRFMDAIHNNNLRI